MCHTYGRSLGVGFYIMRDVGVRRGGGYTDSYYFRVIRSAACQQTSRNSAKTTRKTQGEVAQQTTIQVIWPCMRLV